MAPRRCFLIPAAAALLAACAGQPVRAPDPAVPGPAVAAAPAEAAEARFTPTILDPADPGLLALAQAVSGAGLISFAYEGAGRWQDSRLKAALTQALAERHDLGLVILDTPCAGAAILDTYIAGAQTADLAADTLRAAGIEPVLQTADLAELMIWLRGWNAVFTDRPVRITGRDCPPAGTAQPGRMAIFWGFSHPSSETGERERALAVGGERADGPGVWLAQDFSAAAGEDAQASGWADLRGMPSATGPGTWLSVDILVRHTGPAPAPGR
jgi:hypothetical protein